MLGLGVVAEVNRGSERLLAGACVEGRLEVLRGVAAGAVPESAGREVDGLDGVPVLVRADLVDVGRPADLHDPGHTSGGDANDRDG